MRPLTRGSGFLQECFSYQFRSIPSIIVWTLVFLADVVIVIFVGDRLGLELISATANPHWRLLVFLYLIIAFVLFCIESLVYTLLHRLFR